MMKVTIACIAVCVALLVVIVELLGSADELRVSLDVKSLAHTRMDENQALTVTRRLDNEKLEPVAEPAAGWAEVPAEPSGSVDDAAQPGALSAAEALLKQTLGINEPEPAVLAVDVFYVPPLNCETSGVALAPVTVQYRFGSPSIKGASLGELEILMSEYRQCEGGEFRFGHNPLGKEDATPLLKQLRLDELKYFFLQHRVPETALRFPVDS